MARARHASDWEVDLAAARAVERQVFDALAADRRIRDLRDRTASISQLDFSFTFRGRSITLDVKEKRQRYSSGVGQLWVEVPERNLFVVDETVFRRVVWQGGGGYLAIRDKPADRWCYFGPWELTLGDHVRYARWGKRYDRAFLKGKLLVDLGGAAAETTELEVAELLRVVESSERWRDRPEPYPIHGAKLREIGERPV
ncbi:MAG TPA: hypothetical protein VEJ84_07330 [Acidimicrobiales bacterium]|nr:hypothetical protein [Acidimicrobiales bacterium]